MSGFAPVSPAAGITPVADLFVPDTTQRWPLGMVIDAVDTYFGWGRFIYLKAVAAQVPGNLVTIDETFTATAVASTANTGWPLAVCRQNVGTAAFCWYQIEGMAPIKTANSIATGTAVGLGTAGIAGTLANGKQILGMHVLQASTFTITKANSTTTNGTAIIQVPNVDGLWVGLTLSGTGVGAGTISSIDPSGRFITNSANSTATGSVTVTGTYTNFLLCRFQNPHVQGQTV